MNQQPEINPEKLKKIILTGLGVLILIIVIFKSSITIQAGEAGVLFRPFGGGVDTENTYGEGFHIIAPWNKVITYEVRQQEAKESMSVLSSNGLEISVDITAWHQPAFSDLPKLHQEKGQDYVQRVILPSLRAATRSVIGRYTPEEIYSSKRDVIQQEIAVESKTLLEPQYVQLNEILVRDITLPAKIKQAIENKLEQEQQSLEYEFKLQKAQKEAEKVKIEAQGKADANRILNASLTPNILKEKGIEATLKLSNSPNSKVIVVGNSDGLPLILGNN